MLRRLHIPANFEASERCARGERILLEKYRSLNIRWSRGDAFDSIIKWEDKILARD